MTPSPALRMTDMSPHERPRERLVAQGAAGLSDSELLGLVLGVGRPGQSALALGATLLATAGGLAALARFSVDELATEHGLGTARAARLLATLELGKRAVRAPHGDSAVIRTAADAAALFALRMTDLREEYVNVMLLGNRHEVLRIVNVHRGSASGALICPKAIFRPAVAAAAGAVIVAHNHPSGDPTPSEQDYAATAMLVDAGLTLGISVLDHLVITRNGYSSLRRAKRGYDAPRGPSRPRAT